MIPTSSQGQGFSAPPSLHLDVPQSLGEILDEALAIINQDLDIGDLSALPQEPHSLNGRSGASDPNEDMRQ